MKATCMVCGHKWKASREMAQCPECRSIDVELDEEIVEDIWTRFRCRNCSCIWQQKISSNAICPKCASTDVVDMMGYIWNSGNLILDDLI
ncbi:MAG: hypothetical protein SVM80_07490 [Halobacteriota archaeon]|nr:hypothetical protein [Halobacteriota archaeon]